MMIRVKLAPPTLGSMAGLLGQPLEYYYYHHISDEIVCGMQVHAFVEGRSGCLKQCTSD